MRVLSIGNLYPPHALGGYERIWHACDRHLRARGHTVRVLVSDTRLPAADGEPEDPGVHRELRWYWRDYEFPRVSPVGRLALERRNRDVLRRHLRELSPDVVCWWAMGGMSLSLIEQVRRAGVPAVGVVGDAWMDYGPRVDAWTRMWRRRPRLGRMTERATGIPTALDLRSGARWVFISRHVRDLALDRHGPLPDALVAHPGVDHDAFTPGAGQPWSGRLLYVGRVERPKGVHTAVRALADLPAATLTIDGPIEPAYREELRGLAQGLGVDGRLAFRLSPAGAIADAYARADAVVFPSEWPEPWGLVPLEAMAVGVPVVATATGGAAEYLCDGDNCLVFAPGDASAVVAAVERLAADADLRGRLRAGGLATAARFTQDAFVDRVAAEVERAASPG
jgi:glycosyltransferase involved in cell wall biosynthesis